MPSRTTRSITLSGADAVTFANAQFGSAVLTLDVGRWQWSAWLDPKGRVRALLQMARPASDRLVIVPRGGDAGALMKDLARFVFRSKVSMAISQPLHVADGEAMEDKCFAEEGDTLCFGEGDASLRFVGAHIGSAHDDETWLARHIHKGFAWLPDEALDSLLPPALSMERLHAVAFDKGCFPGQEIAARLHFLGGHKKHLRMLKSDVALRDGDTLRVDERDVGIVLMQSISTLGVIVLAVVDDGAVTSSMLETQVGRLHVLSTFTA